MGSGQTSSSVHLFIMQSLILLVPILALSYGSPLPQEVGSPVALPYVHDATGDVADNASPVAEAYIHDVTGDAAEAYVHDVTGDVAEPYVEPVVAPVTYAAFPYASYPYAGYPYAYAGYPYAAFNYAAYPVAVHATGCVNYIGAVVPCAQ